MNEAKYGKKVIFLLFFASGISGLIYEVVWLRILSRIIGITTYATAITLAAFMAGLALGSFIFGRIADKRNDQLRIFALLQLLVAVAAVVTPVFLRASIPLYKYIHQISNENAILIAVAEVVVSFISLLIPTLLMGGTLPVLTSYIVKKEGFFGKNFSLLYGINTLGAVFGVLLSGFVTIGTVGEWNTMFIGVLINFAVGCIAFLLCKKTSLFTKEAKGPESRPVAPANAPISLYTDIVRKMVLVSILISGFTALAYEVIWTRQLILFLKTSIYAFSGMLAVFLVGVATGSMVMNRFVDRLKTPLVVFGILELFLGVLSIFNLYLFVPLDSSLFTRILAPVVLVFPLTFLFGVIFPVASFCYAKSTDTAGSSVGALYAFNAAGNVAGSLVCGFVFIGLLGSSRTVVLLSWLNVALGLVLLWLEPNKTAGFKLKSLLIVPAVLWLSLAFAQGTDPFLFTIERRIAKGAYSYKIFHNRETVEGTVTSFVKNGLKSLWINGVGQTILTTETKLMAHLPIMLAGEPKEFLAICFGMGTTARSACIYDDLNITCVELVPDVYKCFRYYHGDAEKILSRRNVKVVAGDGRNFLQFSKKKYDVIVVDPSPPIHNAGTVNLYTQQFLSLCEEHLTPNGVMCLWFPGSSSKDDRLHKENSLHILKTFYSVFPNMTVWNGPHDWGFYIIGTIAKTSVDRGKIEFAFTDQRLLKDLSEYDNSCVTSAQLLNLLVFKDKDRIENITRTSSIITDNFPYTEFPLWPYLLHNRPESRNDSAR